MQYIDEVRKFGGPKPYEGDEGRTNLSHEVKFFPADVKTDGKGNIIDMPLLTRKPCFGRPERHFRAMPDNQRAAALENPSLRDMMLFIPGGTPCERCPVYDACETVVFERIDSVPELGTRLNEWAQASDPLQGEKRFVISPARETWAAFLEAIISGGGWSSVNDARVAAAVHEAKEKRDENRRTAARRKRQANGRRHPSSPPSTIDDRLTHAIDQESDRRRALLLDMISCKSAPKPIRNLNVEKCQRLIDVWKAQASLAVAGHQASRTRDIVAWLKQHAPIEGVQEQSLPTIVSRAIERISALKKEVKGIYIWAPFCPFTAAGLPVPLFFSTC